MSDRTSVKWHEILNAAPSEEALAFAALYREYAAALHERIDARRQGFWPYPR